MTLASDTQLGSYKIESLIGRGGMGEVYLARDTSLDRAVAIKVLPESFAANPERVARFEREARLLATLSHQNIAGIYGLEEAEGRRYLVLELVEGQTLKDHLAKGAIPVEETLRVCRQIADALATAHEKGIIHRDLKPGNIMITPDDTVKVLDFGIAKALDPIGTATSLADGATWSVDHQTAAGTMVGTPAYMSPEQARGKPIDKRSDIWSFGCLLYECLTGATVFGGETVTDTLARILEREPDFSLLPAATPPTAHTLLRRCLQKDRKKRLHDIADARVQIEEAIADPAGSTLGLSGTYIAVEKAAKRSKLPWMCVAGCAVLAVAAWWRPQPVAENTAPRVDTACLAWVATDADVEWDDVDFDVSPDGRSVVFTARPVVPPDAEKPPYQLFIRRLDAFVSSPIEGTERGSRPVFAPGGQWIAFTHREETTGRKVLRRVTLDGSPAVAICDMTDHNLDTYLWLSDDRLLVAEDGPGQFKAVVAVDSGTIEPIELDTSKLGDFLVIGTSSVLPGGTHVLGFTWRVLATRVESNTILIALDDWSCRKILDNAAYAQYAASGHLVFMREEVLLAAPFDTTTGQLTGRVMPLISGVDQFDLARSGALVYHPTPGAVETRRIMKVGEESEGRPLSPIRRPFQGGIAVSPDGRWLGLMTWDGQNTLPRIWLYEVATGSIRPLTAANEVCFGPVFSRDGAQVAYLKWDSESPRIMVRSTTNGAAEPRQVYSFPMADGFAQANCWTPDGSGLLLTNFKRSRADSDIIHVDFGTGEATPLLSSAVAERMPQLSPDGRWMLYGSEETGQFHLHLRPFDAATRELGPSTQITTDPGASSVMWSPDGSKIYYVDRDDHLVAVAMTTAPVLTLSDPEPVLDIEPLRVVDRDIKPLADGDFAFVQQGEQEKEAEYLNVVLNWFEELNRKVPAGAGEALSGR